MADMSFGDIRVAVRSALAAIDKDKGDDLCVCDLGTDWVVYSDPDTDGPGECRRGYTIDSSGNVKFTSDPVKVSRTTSWDAVQQPKTLKEAAAKVLQMRGKRKSTGEY